MKSSTITRTVRLVLTGSKIKIEIPRKALSIRQPWASSIAWKQKTLEVRSWRTHYRGPLTIVSSAKPDMPLKELKGYEDATGLAFPLGCMICTVDLVDVRPGNKSDTKATGGIDPTGQFVWVLENAVPVLGTVPVKGRLGIFDIQ